MRASKPSSCVISSKFADHLFFDVTTYAFPVDGRFTTPQIKKQYADKLLFLARADGPKRWSRLDSFQVAKLHAAAAHLLFNYAETTNDGVEADEAVREYEWTFQLVGFNPELPDGPVNSHSGLDYPWYPKFILLSARLNNSIEMATKAIRIAQARYDEALIDRRAELWVVNEHLAEALFVKAKITNEPRAQQEAALRSCHALVELRHFGVPQRGEKPTGQAAMQPGSIDPIDAYVSYKIFEQLGYKFTQLPDEETSCDSLRTSQ
jgi:hypothetical protein